MSGFRILRVFEHQTLHVRRGEAGEEGLTEAELDALIRFNDAHQGRYFTVGHRRLTFGHYVGYLQVGRLGIEVLPKVDRGGGAAASGWREGLVRMIEVAGGVSLETPTEAAQEAGRSSLLELVASRFLSLLEKLLHEGLAKGYRSEEANSSVYRGRLLVKENLRANVARADRFFVRYTTYDRATVLNRLLAAALEAIIDLDLAPRARHRVAAAQMVLPEPAALRSVEDAFARLQLGRSTERYRSALTLARMLLELHAPRLRSGRAPVLAILFEMHVLWERYVAALLRRMAPPGLLVSAQESRPFWRGQERPWRPVRPDIVVRTREGDRVVLVADTKWKVPRDGQPAEDDLRQMFVYNELFHAPEALLIYPSAGASQTRAGAFREKDHRCGTLELGLLEGERWCQANIQRELAAVLARVTPSELRSAPRG